ncbi:MAG: hypothetical protein NTY00_03455 [Deltaproteobacteria bacterium]|nr:hypothetical protein [Deltaproteobacteria bacterium]
MDEIQKIINQIEPEKALTRLGVVLRGLFSQVSEELRLDFVVNLIGEAGADKVASLVHL